MAARAYPDEMADTTNSDESGSHLLRWLFLIAVAIGAIAAGRQWALSKADAEFEARLLAADEQRD